MISIITQRFQNSLASLNANQLKLLTNRTTTTIYREFNNIIMDIQSPETTDIVNSMNETHDNRIKALKNEHQEEIDRLINKNIDEINNFSIKIEKIKEELRFENDIKMENIQNLHNEALNQKSNHIDFYRNQLEELKIKSDVEINYFKEQLHINQSNLDSLKEDFFKSNSRSNVAKGDIGENLVLQALNDNPRYNDISIESTCNIKGYGDLLVNIPSIDFKCIIEVKAETTIQTQKDIVQFDEHREKFFKEFDNGHALFFSLKAPRIPQLGSYNIINKNGSFTGYFASENMQFDEIKCKFYGFIDTILTERNLNNKNDNTIDLCENLAENSNLLSEIVDDNQKKIKYYNEQIKISENLINKINNNIKNNNNVLKEEGFNVNSTLVCKTKEEKLGSLKKYLIENDLFSINDTKSDFKSNWTKKIKEDELLKKDKILYKFNLPKSTSYDNIFYEISKII